MKGTKKIFIFLLVVAIGFLFSWYVKVKWDINKLNEQVKAAYDEIGQIEAENERLEEMEVKLSDPFFKEKLAREKLGLARKKEVVYQIIPEEKLNSPK